MSVNPVENQKQAVQEQTQEQKQSDKEYNFAQIRKQLDQERLARQQAEEKANQLMQQHVQQKQNADDDDGDDEPYVDKKRLKKELVKVVQQTSTETENKIQNAVQKALAEERKNQWLENNPDFYEVMNHAQKFADKAPGLAKTILAMPDNFERQQLVYENIKTLGFHKKEEPKSTVQDRVNQNQRNPYYQPSGIGTAPYAAAADYSPTGQKTSYDKMKELQARLRLG